ncbi:MAG: CoA-binding protein [Anaerolineae bacterium]|nr:CoA-binding protein [Anaerolineae bacterium]
MNDDQMREELLRARTVAVVGMSANPQKAAHRVPRFLIQAGYQVIPVNPFAGEILGRPAYPDLMAVPGRIDIVDVFRPSADALGVVKQAIARHEARGDVSLIWLQLGIANETARALAEAAGIPFVQDRCMAIEAPRLFPGGKVHPSL